MSVTAAIQTRIAEDIALLHALAENPSVAVRPATCKRNMTQGYSISLEIEREFASDMAFLSSIRDDPTRITAVAVHETEDGCLRVLVAANANKDKSSQTYLDEVKRGFDLIAHVMSMAATMSQVQLEMDVLDLIIRMCRSRILKRVKRQDSTLLPNHLTEAVKILEGKKESKTQKIFVDKAKLLLDNLRSLGLTLDQGIESIGISNGDLKNLIKCCSDWEKELDLESFVHRNLHWPEFDTSKAKSICNTVRKVGRYQICAARLTQFAANNVLFRSIQTVRISLDQEALQHNTEQGRARADKVMMRVSSGKLKEAQLSNMLQSASSKVAMTRQKFKASLRVSQGKDAKIHAEVQLLWFLKSLKLEKPPRVIESSKMACYLCSALIACTGEYYSGRSHGRVYPGWRLPLTTCDGVHKKFARYLETYIVDSLKDRIESGIIRKGPIADCESSATVHRVPLEAVLSPLLEVDEKKQQEEVEVEVSEIQTPLGTEETTDKPRELLPEGETQGTARGNIQDGLGARAPENFQDTTPVNGEERGIHNYVERDMAASATGDTRGRSPGPGDSVEWIRLPRGHTVCTHPCETLQVLIEHDGQKSSDLRVRVRQVCSSEAVKSFNKQDVHIIDELSDFGTEVTCGKGGDPVLLRLGDKTYVVEVEVAGLKH
ncbi:hypothetical protein CC79DRAFT_428360 [Sarocladium strictum]